MAAWAVRGKKPKIHKRFPGNLPALTIAISHVYWFHTWKKSKNVVERGQLQALSIHKLDFGFEVNSILNIPFYTFYFLKYKIVLIFQFLINC